MEPRQTLAACLEVAEQTLDLTNKEAWWGIYTEFQARGFRGRRLSQMCTATWEERRKLRPGSAVKTRPGLASKPPEPDVFQPTRCGPVIDGLLQGLEKSVTRA